MAKGMFKFQGNFRVANGLIADRVMERRVSEERKEEQSLGSACVEK